MVLIIPFGGLTPRIDPSAWVAPNATLIGDVVIDANASVFYGAVLRADRDSIRIGAGSNVQDNVTMHTDAGLQLVVGERVSIGHNAVVHGSRIDDDCLIGMAATLLNGSHIGAGSLVAANALVLENATVAPASLVAGVPGRTVRSLTPDERQGLVENARRYAMLSQEHRVATG